MIKMVQKLGEAIFIGICIVIGILRTLLGCAFGITGVAGGLSLFVRLLNDLEYITRHWTDNVILESLIFGGTCAVALITLVLVLVISISIFYLLLPKMLKELIQKES